MPLSDAELCRRYGMPEDWYDPARYIYPEGISGGFRLLIQKPTENHYQWLGEEMAKLAINHREQGIVPKRAWKRLGKRIATWCKTLPDGMVCELCWQHDIELALYEPAP